MNKNIFILDNLSSHYYQEIKNLSQKLNIIFLSPYSSNFNLIELFFNYLKAKVYDESFETVNMITKKIINVIKESPDEDLIFYERKCITNMIKVL